MIALAQLAPLLAGWSVVRLCRGGQRRSPLETLGLAFLTGQILLTWIFFGASRLLGQAHAGPVTGALLLLAALGLLPVRRRLAIYTPVSILPTP